MPKIDQQIDASIFSWDIQEDEYSLLKLVNLDDYETELLQKHALEKRRKELLAARLLLQQNFPKAHIHYHQKKPIVVGENIEISISNSQNLVAIQIQESKKKAGIDLQCFSQTVLKIKHKFLHPEEIKQFDCDDIQVLNIIWSAKEALYKAYSENKLEFKKQLICRKITPKKIFGDVILENNKVEYFELGLFLSNEYLVVWYINY